MQYSLYTGVDIDAVFGQHVKQQDARNLLTLSVKFVCSREGMSAGAESD